MVRAGRPSKLTEETLAALEQGIKAQLPYKLACAAAGIGYSTFREWMVSAEKIREGAYVGKYKTELLEFEGRIKKAEAEGAKTLMTLIWRSATEGSWQAALAILERRHKKEFSLRSEQAIIGTDEGPVELTLTWSDTPPLPNQQDDAHDTKEDPRR